jgi:hypothetical protein
MAQATAPFLDSTHLLASGPAYSALMLAARMTFPHFSVSSAMSLRKSSGEPGRTLSGFAISVAIALAIGIAFAVYRLG